MTLSWPSGRLLPAPPWVCATSPVYVPSLAQQQKADGSVVTEADLAVEEEVRRVLLAERPEDAFLGEETGGEAMERAGVDGYSTARWCSSRETIAGSP